MAITMQGAWTVAVKSKSAAFPQRFIIAGADVGDGVYDGETSTGPIFANGAQWSISIQNNPTGPESWTPSAERITFPVSVGGQVKFDIQSNDAGGDVDYNDLILTCSMAASPSEYVIYGTVKSHTGICLFNPCGMYPWVVIDSVKAVELALNYPVVKSALEKLYPERMKNFVQRRRGIKPPLPIPDPGPFRPMIIPLGQSQEETYSFTQALPAVQEVRANVASRKAIAAPVAQRMEIGATALTSVASYALDIAKLKDSLQLACSSKIEPGLLLRFLEYDRTAAELAGGAYTGDGNRQNLGMAVTDEQGNYIFRFSQDIGMIVEESGDIVAGGPDLATQLRPDIIAQVVSGGAAGVLYESGLYPNITNLKRIDLCVVLDSGPTACQGGRAIQAIGNIFTIPGVGNTLDADGRITATNSTGPIITRGAWAGRLDLYACFLEHPEVEYYTIRYRRPGGAWAFVNEQYKHIRIADIGLPGYTGTPVGPADRSLAVDGGAHIMVPSYINIESDPAWIATHRLRKMQLNSSFYENALYGPTEAPRSVDFKIQGYDSTGNFVAGAEDTIRLFIDNRPVDGDVDTVSMGAVSPGECALFDLPTPDAVLTVRFKVNQPGGFVEKYSLDVVRGSNTTVPVSDTTAPIQPLSLTYNEALYGNTFFGTLNAVAPDGDGYVLAELQPNSGSWLPTGHNFCAFEFSVSGTPRTTNGYGTFPGRILDRELIGISYAPPVP